MTEKVKVPKWFDEWYKSFGSDTFRLHYINLVGFSSSLIDGKGIVYGGKTEYIINNKIKLNRAILDGYEVERYIEISPIEAYEGYFNDREVFYKREDDLKYYSASIIDFMPSDIKENNIKFYINISKRRMNNEQH